VKMCLQCGLAWSRALPGELRQRAHPTAYPVGRPRSMPCQPVAAPQQVGRGTPVAQLPPTPGRPERTAYRVACHSCSEGCHSGYCYARLSRRRRISCQRMDSLLNLWLLLSCILEQTLLCLARSAWHTATVTGEPTQSLTHVQGVTAAYGEFL
jgi:hypothetical protein